MPRVRGGVQGRRAIDLLAASGLVRGVNDLEVYVMAEIPANAILVDEFAALFDGFSLNPDAVVRGLEAATPSWRASCGRSRRAGAAGSWSTCGGPSTP